MKQIFSSLPAQVFTYCTCVGVSVDGLVGFCVDLGQSTACNCLCHTAESRRNLYFHDAFMLVKVT